MSSDEGGSNIPSVGECDDLLKRFCEVTAAVSPEAIQYLQQSNWDLDRALETYLAAAGGSPQKATTSQQAAKVTSPDLGDDPTSFRLMSWNLDGLDPVSLVVRTKAATDVMKAEQADIIFLQELVASTWDQVKVIMGNRYEHIQAPSEKYFTGILLKKSTVRLDNLEVIPYETKMMRNLLVVYANVKGVDVKLMNSHLESTAQHSDERIKQLHLAMGEMTSTNPNVNVIFGGDTNLGAKDFSKIEFPSDIFDIWEELGHNKDTRYTWDTQRNDNKDFCGPRCRFDRLYMRKSGNVTPVHFGLSGLERVPNCSRFPSDHWAITAQFAIKTEK